MNEYEDANCCEDGKKHIAFYKGYWRYEHDDGLAGTVIAFCPFCGKKLSSPTLPPDIETAALTEGRVRQIVWDEIDKALDYWGLRP